MNGIFNDLWDKIWSWFEGFVIMLPNLGVAIIVLIGFFFISKLLKKGILKVLSKLSDNQAVNRLVAKLVTAIVMIIGLFIALGILELDKTVTSLLAGAGVIGLAVGLAFQDPILNVISGIILSVRDRPFKLGDLIRTNGHYGHVKRITIRTTIIKSLTGEEIIIPNKSVVQNPLVNYSFSTNRRVDIACGVEYSSDLEEVQKTAVNAIENSIKELDGKEVEFMFTEFGDSSINFTLRYWIEETGEKNFLISRGKSIIALKKAFDEKGISIPFPIRTLEFSQKNVVEGLSSGKKS
ncbi:MAG: small conductance mechanosensitive channel [Crocinitomicaceae bacterium]|jgi:small conductance mechanosensitive channel